ncbi:hypothetical protein PSECIP111951_00775 [Pseudoalteromonas holothuriae]|uniref:DUF1653 domain-containing protein n=1 Tax=Pseudoalteromonas holothuriae TaxID=2963714 RepID=A0A9W4QWJ7_9GAMM|nr:MULTISPECIES: DUF1653 domain-containing protein [unclassified Pseudoalteromonas]CAH9053210.1 hypothetical protein PSECIP111951_00775 [Pseudoalteromonas sp. CIP111951]CAH9056318.1 hypothetical protein PSECIP111854_01768 [Pseudoalteromonas sp. CIP111854]
MKQLLKAGIYQHYKGPKYHVHHVATHSETGEAMVVYQTLYGDFDFWVRPLEMFNEQVLVEGTLTPRFKFVGTN